MLYNIRQGDYAKLTTDEVGFVVEYKESPFDDTFLIWIEFEYGSGKSSYKFDEISKYFKRIGQYDFTDKNKIEPLENVKCGRYREEIKDGKLVISFNEFDVIRRLPNNQELMDKINEIIEHINKENK